MVKKWTVMGLMSGTSLDGLDLSVVDFFYENNKWKFEILKSRTVKYENSLKQKLANAIDLNGLELNILDIELGEFFGQCAKSFIQENNFKIDLIASHGHTIFHQPEKRLTLQIGSGYEIVRQTNLPLVFDFRSKDVSIGGQGAPLVPIGDQLLFSEFDACLNFGGIANISFEKNNQRVAFDIGPFNMGLNYFANQLNFDFDKGGEIAKSGKLNKQLLKQLNNLSFYNQSYPKSLGVEWFESQFLPICLTYKISVEDILHTISHHIATQISDVLSTIPGDKVLITGGGVYNTFIVELLKSKTDKSVIIPSSELIDFKEAMIFAFLGVLKWNNQINVLSAVTGAIKDSSSGQLILP